MMKKQDPGAHAMDHPIGYTGEAAPTAPWTIRMDSVKLSNWRGEFTSNLV